MENSQLTGFGQILLFLIGSIIFVAGGLFTARLIRPRRPNAEKLTTYECGEEPTGSAWGQFNVRFYIIALIFILFDVELIFLFPWATVFADAEYQKATEGLWSIYALAEMFLFIGILALGLAYAWAKGYLDWVKPEVKKPGYKGKVPASLYNEVNIKYAKRVKIPTREEEKV